MTFDVFLGYRLVFGVGSLRGETACPWQTKRDRQENGRGQLHHKSGFRSRKVRQPLRVAKNFRMSDCPIGLPMLARNMKHPIAAPLLACLLVFGVLSCVRAQNEQAAKDQNDNGYAQISIFAKAVQLIRQDYVDGDKTSYHNLITAALKGMLGSLDPHSQFMDPSDFRDMQEDTRSRFNGLGIEVAVKNGLPTVVTPMEDTPAARAGVLSGDQILRINGASTERMDLQDVINHLRGTPGKHITQPLLRPSTPEVKEKAR